MDKDKTFTDFLSNKHAEQYDGLDDEMPDDFNEWLENLDINECIGYADEYVKEEVEKKTKELLHL